jgi:Legume lectin domain/Chitobiase/beta-hexosaminidase C-terminal domain
VAHEYYNSTQAGSRDKAGNAVKFAVPTIANGKVYVGTQTEVDVYGLIGSGEEQVATPSISPSSGTESSPVTVTLTDSTAGATITYTTDGSTPVPGTHGTAISSGGSFSLSFTSTATVEAIASASGMTNSGIATATYTTQSSGGGPSYGSGFTSTGLTLNGNAAINGTRLRLTDGGTNEAGSAFFNTLVNVQSFTTNFSFQLTDATADGIIFTIQGDGPTALGQNGAKLGWAFGKTGTSGIGNSVAVKFDIYNNDGEGTDSTGMFTDGTRPTIPAVDMTSSGLNLLSGDVMNVSMTYNGTTLTWTITDATTGKTFTTSAAVDIPSFVGGNTAYVGFTASTEAAATAIQDILTWTFASGSSQQQVATPSISPSSGTESSPVTVTLTDSTAGATITYTTDGSTPVPGTHGTAISSGGSFSLSFTSTATVEAIASASGMTNSGIATATYTTQSSGGGPSYGSGFTSTGLTLNGNAAINGTRLRLTDGGTNEAGSAFFNTLVNVQSFTTNFSFQLTDATADGIIFTIQGDGPTALGQNGAKLGWAFGKTGTSGIGNSVAVKFDIYNNDGEGTDSTGMFTDGTRPTIPAVDMTSSGLNLLSGDVMNVSMTYNGTTLTWTITDATTGKTFTTSAAVDIPSFVGGNTAYVGFTASTEAAATAIQDILTWTFVPGT